MIAKKLFVQLSLCATAILQAQNVSIPDANFKKALLENTQVNKNSDTEITEDEAKVVTVLNVRSKGIKSLVGIEKFTNLDFLYCQNNQITLLDLSGCKYLDVLKCDSNQLQALDVSSLATLSGLHCSHNRLTALTLQPHKVMADLNVAYNELSTIVNLGAFEESIRYLNLQGNAFTALDLSGLKILERIDVSGNRLRLLKVPYGFHHVRCAQNPQLNEVCVASIDFAVLHGNKDAATQWVECWQVEKDGCLEHMGEHYVCEDYLTMEGSATGEYLLETDKIRWDGMPKPDEKAYRGLFWSEVVAKNGFTAKKARAGDGVLSYTITQAAGVYEPFVLSFGSYANEGLEQKFTIDLSSSALLEFDLKNASDQMVSIHVALEDIQGNSLVYDKAGLNVKDPRASYNFIVGEVMTDFASVPSYWRPSPLVDERSLEAKFWRPFGVSRFTYDFKDAVGGRDTSIIDIFSHESIDGEIPSRKVPFDYTQVAMVKIHVSGTFFSHFGDLIDAPIELYNFKLGDVGLVSSLDKQPLSKQHEEVYEVYDVLGNYITQGTESTMALSKNALYILKSPTAIKKKILIE